MNRIALILLPVVMVFVASSYVELSAKAKSRTESIVVINGAQYYLHPTEKGDTIYSLTKLYDVSEEDLLAINHDLSNGLKVGMRIRIPRRSPEVETVNVVEQQEESAGQEHDVEEAVIDSLDVDSLVADSLAKLMSYEWHRVSLDGEAPAGLMYYDVEDGDDLRSVAKAYGMSVEQLRRVNNIRGQEDLFDSVRLASSRKILVRDGSSTAATVAYTSDKAAMIERRVSDVEFNMLSKEDTLRVALMLPLSVNGRAMQPFVEFYQGVLLGVEELKRDGRSVVLNLYNTERNAMAVRDVMSQPSYQACQLIIGPVYENLLGLVLNDAELRSVPVVSPLAAVAKSDSPVLFQMAADSKHRYDKMDDLLGADRRVTLIEGETNDEEFRAEVLRILAIRDVEYLIHEYEYEHPSSIEEREREAERVIKAARELAEELGEELDVAVVDSLSAKISKSDLTTLLMGESVQADRLLRDGVMGSDDELSDSLGMRVEADAAIGGEAKRGEIVTEMSDQDQDFAEKLARELERRRNEPIYHTLFIMSDSEIEVDRILSALSSAYAAQVAKSRGSGRNIRKQIQYEVVANPEWRRYKNIDRAIYFRNRVSLFSSYLAGRDAESIREFDSRYGREFGEFPSLYSYRGYDVMKIFGEGLFSGDILHKMSGRTYQPLQSKYIFARDEERATIVNINWMRESYKSNFTKSRY